MKARFFGELTLHDGKKVVIHDRKTADLINNEFEWTVAEATKRATKFTIRAIQCLFALKLGDRYGWTTERLARLLKDVAGEAEFIINGETDMDEDLAELRDNYGIDLREDGMIRAEYTIEDNIYGRDEWRPLAKRRPTKDDDYLCTDSDGDVRCCTWYGNHFVDEAGYDEEDIVAWKPMPEPWEFWKEEAETA